MKTIIKNKKSIILVIFVLFLIITSIFIWNDRMKISVSAAGESWLSGWSQRKAVTVTNNNTAFTGTLNGNATLGSTTSKFGTAISFDGSGDYVSVPDSTDWDLGNVFTIDFWSYRSSTNQMALFEQRTDDNNRTLLYYNSGYPGLIFFNTSGGTLNLYAHTAGAISANAWHHIAVVKTSSTFNIYVDGKPQTISLDGGSLSSTITGSAAPFNIGLTNSVADYSGIIDEFRISKGVARWTADFSASLPTAAYTADASTKLLLHFDEAVGATSTVSDSSLINYQLKIPVSYVSGMNSDFSDLRFTSSDGATELDYWIESYVASTSAVVWVEAPSLAVGSNTIYMYYGKSSATTTSNCENTFVFCDEFTGSTISTSKWVETDSGGYISQNGDGVLTISNGAGSWGTTGLHTVSTFNRSDDLIVQGRYKTTLAVGSSYQDGTVLWVKDSGTGTNWTDYIYGVETLVAGTSKNLYIVEDGNDRGSMSQNFVSNTQYDFRQKINSTGCLTQISSDNGGTWTDLYNSTYSTEGTFKIGFTHFQGGVVTIDNVIARKYTSVEPTVSFATAETAGIVGFAIKKDDGCECSSSDECYYGECNSGICGVSGPTATNLTVPSEVE